MRSSAAAAAAASLFVLVGCRHHDFNAPAATWEGGAPAADAAVASAPLPSVPPLVTDPLLEPARSSTFVDDVMLSTVLIHATNQWGTGWVIAARGSKRIVVTNRHVIAPSLARGEKKAIVRGFFLSSTGKAEGRQAKVLATDERRDIAILELDFPDRRVRSLRLATEKAPSGRVLLAGFPFGNLSVAGENASPAVNYGVTDGDVKQSFGNTFIKVSAGVHPGNSGGPVLSPQGEVIGVATLQSYSDASVASATRFNYAVPISYVVALAKAKKIDLTSDRLLAGTTPADVVTEEAPTTRASLATVQVTGDQLACVVVATGRSDTWLMCDPSAATITTASAIVTAEATAPRPVSLVTQQGNFTLFRGQWVTSAPVATIASSSSLHELDVLRRLRPRADRQFGAETRRISSVRRLPDGEASSLLIDAGLDDESPANGLYFTSDGRFVGVESGAVVGTNLRGLVLAEALWPAVEDAAAGLLPDGYTITDASGFEAHLPRLAARVDGRWNKGAAATAAYRTFGAPCAVEGWSTPPEGIEALLGRSAPRADSIRAEREGSTVVRVDVGAGVVRRVVDGSSFVRVTSNTADPSCRAKFRSTGVASSHARELDAWYASLTKHAADEAKKPKVARASVSTSKDEAPVCGIWSWPMTRSPDRTFGVKMPCAPTKRQSLAGQALVTTFTARPTARHLFETSTWLNAASGGEEDTATSSYDSLIDSYLQVNLLEEQFAKVKARTGTNEAIEIPLLDRGEERDRMSGMLQTGTLPDGRTILGLAALDRGNVVYLLTAIVPAADEEKARRFVTSFHLLVEGEDGPAVRLELDESKQGVTRKEEIKREQEEEKQRRQSARSFCMENNSLKTCIENGY